MHKKDESQGKVRAAVLKLVRANAKEITRLVELVKADFRDVIYWTSIE